LEVIKPAKRFSMERALVAPHGVGAEIASRILVAAGDDRERLRTERFFAALCGACPLPASSGKTQRHRLNRARIDRPIGPYGPSL
jgi:transposase